VIVGVDYTAAAWQGAGIGRYTRELVRATVAQDRERRYTLFYAARGLPADSPYLAALRALCRQFAHVRARPIGLSPRQLTILWQRLRLPLRAELLCGHLDLLHCPDFVLPPTRARTLLTVHDLSFLLFDDVHLPATRAYLKRALPPSLRRADGIVADSESTRRDLLRLMGVEPARARVVYSGADAQFRPLPPASLADARARLSLPARFLLHVGTLEPRKNLVRLIEALARLEQPDLSLVLVGRRGWMYEPIFTAVERHRLQGRVRMLDFVADADLPLLYNLAEAFVYPSLYEGFGLPPLEALACGTPVVTSDTSSLPEVVGAAAVLINPCDVGSLAEGIRRVLNDAALAVCLREAGPQQAANFSWERSARQLLDCYAQVMRQA
jgi:glycosyltransferase involved in cell wall biosynthesis